MLLVFPIKTHASSMIDKIKPVEYTEEYKQYLQLPEEQRKNRKISRQIPDTKVKSRSG